MQNSNLKRTLQDDLMDAENDSVEDSVEAAVNLSKGKKRTQVIYRAIVCYFLEKETLKNPYTFNPKIFLKNHPQLTFEAVQKWKASTDLGIAKIFEKIKSGSVLPFEEQPNITWLRNGQLLPFRDVPIPLQQQYIADPMKFRVAETKRKKKSLKIQKKITDQFIQPINAKTVDSLQEIAFVETDDNDNFQNNDIMGDHDQFDNHEMFAADEDTFPPTVDNEQNLLLNSKNDGKCYCEK